MEFKVLVVVFGFLAVAASASDSVSRYITEITKDGQRYDEEVEIDTEKKTETFHVPKTSPDTDKAVIISDFKKKMTMFRVPITKSCFLYDSTENLPKPEELVLLLKRNNYKALLPRDSTELRLNVLNTVYDRSGLSDEMAALCEEWQIFNVAKGTPADDKMPSKRKRRWPCSYACRKICSYFGCTKVCKWIC